MYENFILLDQLDADYLQEIDDFLKVWFNDSSEIQVQTSGSTGQPKMMTFQKEQLRLSARATGAFFDFEQGQTLLLNLSPKFIAGKLMLVRAFEFNMKVIVAPLASNPLKSLKDYNGNIDFAAFVPAQVEAIISLPGSKGVFEKIKHVIIGGAPIKSSLFSELTALSNHIYATFGMTETLTHVALKKIDPTTVYFKCLQNIYVSQDARGCLVIRAPYLKEEVVTNDIVALKDEKSFEWLGRLDNVINSGGVKLFPEQIEQKLIQVFPEHRFFISGAPNEKWGEEVVLHIEGDQQMFDMVDLNEKIETCLEKYERPTTVLFVDKFKETGSGKVIRN
jgi:O-succinylbenzoic acid--CoA ligase